MEKNFDVLRQRTGVVEKLVKHLRERVRELAVERMKEIECMRESLEERVRDLERREKEFDAFEEAEKRKLACEEEELRLKKQKFQDDVKMREEKLDEQMVSVKKDVERLRLAEAEVEAIRRGASEKLKGIEIQEQNLRLARESLAERERKVGMIMEREKEMVLKEEQLIEREKVVRQLSKRLELAQDNMEGLKKEVDERYKKICVKEMQLKSTSDWVERKMDEVDFKAKELKKKEERIKIKEADLIRGLMEKQLEEFEKMKSESNSFLEAKMQELACKEHLLDVMSKELVKDAELRNEQLIEREKVAHQLLKRLELAQDNVEGLKKEVDNRLKKICAKEMQLNSTSDWVERKMDKVDSKAKKLKKKEKRIKVKKDKVIYKIRKLQGKKKELDLGEKTLLARQKKLEVRQKEVDLEQQLNEQRQEKLDVRERSLNSVREFIRTCFNEHLAIKRKLSIEKDLVEKRARDLRLKKRRLEPEQRVLEFREKQMRGHVEELELKQPTDVLNDHLKIKPDESVDLKFIVRMDGKTLQMFLNDPEKDLESMGDEIFKVLHLSSDPAKLVLDAMVGFYPPHLREEDSTFNVRRTCITLLQQLIRMSKRIKPHVRQEAIEFATSWKSKMEATAENPNSLEALGFLQLLAAYNIASDFDKDEISSFLKMVAQHRETPELCQILGFAQSTTGTKPM